MKNLLILLTLSLMLFSCTDATYENSADGLTVIESNEILSQKTDTIVVINYNKRIYVVDNDKVIATTIPINEASVVPIPFFWFSLIIIFVFFVGLIIGLSNS